MCRQTVKPHAAGWLVISQSQPGKPRPKCQASAAKRWLATRQQDLLPVEYYHVVFTLPEEIAELAYQNKTRLYRLLFRATAETLFTIAADPKRLGAQIGALMVLHTWGSSLTHHPHVHCVVPGGGLSLDGQSWMACRSGFFLPVRVLSRLFRRLFLSQLTQLFQDQSLTFHCHLASYVQMEGLPGARKTSTKNHDPGRGRIYAALPATFAAERVSSHTTLRHSG